MFVTSLIIFLFGVGFLSIADVHRSDESKGFAITLRVIGIMEVAICVLGLVAAVGINLDLFPEKISETTYAQVVAVLVIAMPITGVIVYACDKAIRYFTR